MSSIHWHAAAYRRLTSKVRRSEDTKLLYASAATRFARQELRESQIQAALAHELFVSVIHGVPVAGHRPAAADAHVSVRLAHWAPAGLLVFFVSSLLRFFAFSRRPVTA